MSPRISGCTGQDNLVTLAKDESGTRLPKISYRSGIPPNFRTVDELW